MSAIVHAGDCRDVMRTFDADSFHAVATDPPYGLGFMGRGWDRGIPGVEFWAEALRVAKPGAHLVAFGGTRTYHRLACAIEDAGWEIRDCLMWIYGSGFPKSLDVSKAIDARAGATREVVGHRDTLVGNGGTGNNFLTESSRQRLVSVTAPATDAAREWSGYGTALKPAYEPIILARKPLAGTVAQTVLEHGCGALNIDGCRIAGTVPARVGSGGFGAAFSDDNWQAPEHSDRTGHEAGRWPANLVLGCACEREHDPGCAAAMLDAQSGTETGAHGRRDHDYGLYEGVFGPRNTSGSVAADAGGASRFFYTAKATREERERGLEHRQQRVVHDGRKISIDNPYLRAETKRGNTHPTVKPVSLMRWLVRLVGGKRGSRILDPFCGSGTTGIACELEGFNFVGIDLDPEHCELARGRILAAAEEAGTATAEALAAVPDRRTPVQMGLLDTVEPLFSEQEG